MAIARAWFTALSAFLLSSPALGSGCPVWLQLQPSAPLPAPRGEHGMAFDSVRGKTVLVGGADTLSFASTFRETWEFDGSATPPAWTLRTLPPPALHPSNRCDNAVAYDPVRGLTVSFGGFNGAFLGDTWEWNGAAWASRTFPPGAAPSPRADSFMVYDSARQRMVLFGGLGAGSVVLGDTWEYDGVAWVNRQLMPPAAPAPRWIHRMAYDPQRGRTVLHGGASPTGVLGDTWEFDGTVWTQVAAGGPTPGPRYGHTMAFDSTRHVALLFGGQTGFNFGVGVLGDTWEFNGAAWVELTGAAGGPPARSFGKMVYDSQSGRAVLFGGYNGAAFVNDTWEFSVSSSDFNADGDSATDADIEAFFACLAGSCCVQCGSADFNGDGDNGTDADIESFFRVLAGGAC